MAQEKKVRLESTELAWLTEQLALIQRSGLSLGEGIDMLAESSDMPRLTWALQGLGSQMQKMIPLSEAMTNLGGFPDYLLRMTAIGEVSGNLDQVMGNLADYYNRDAELRRKLRGALIYPIVLLCMMFAIIVLLIVRVLPIFSQILASFGGQMPAVSQALLNFGLWTGSNLIWLLPVLVVVILGRGAGQRWLDRVRLHLPVVGPLMRRIYASRFAMAMSYLLHSGIDLDTALGLTENMMGNTYFSARIGECREKIAKGIDAFDAIEQTNLFPKLFVRMLALGNRTGDLEKVMGKVARSYESEVDSHLTRLTSLVEPLLVVILSVIVGIILLTVMMPLVEIMSTVG
jgi:type IV pilus assembly protein PilC